MWKFAIIVLIFCDRFVCLCVNRLRMTHKLTMYFCAINRLFFKEILLTCSRLFKAYILYGMQYCCALVAFKNSSCDDFDIRKMCLLCAYLFSGRNDIYYIVCDSSGKLYRISLSLWLFISFVRSNGCSHKFVFYLHVGLFVIFFVKILEYCVKLLLFNSRVHF